MTNNKRDSVEGLARVVVTKLDQSELVYFDMVSSAFWETGGRLTKTNRGSGSQYIDIPGLATALTPIVLIVSSIAVTYLGKVIEGAASQAGKDAWEALKSRLAKSNIPPASDRIRLGKSDQDMIARVLLTEAKKHLDDRTAANLADAVIEVLIETSSAEKP